MPVTVKKKSLERYTPTDSAQAKELQRMRMARQQTGEKMGGLEKGRDLAGDLTGARKSAYIENTTSARMDTTLNKALKDVRAEKFQTPAPMKEDVRMVIRKKSKK
jgi:hypothetical protein